MIGSWDGVSFGAETVLVEEVFSSRRRNPHLVLSAERQGSWAVEGGYAWLLVRPLLWIQINKQKSGCDLACHLS